MDIRTNVPLAPYTTLDVGGPADFFVCVTTIEELRDAIAYAHKHALPVTVLGGGSNVLINDDGIRGLVIKNSIKHIAYRESTNDAVATVGAGVVWDEFVDDTVLRNLWGLENLSAIPGTVGGAVVQNINAYGVTIETSVVLVETLHIPTCTVRTFKNEECNFVYRNSFFKQQGLGKEYIITSVELRLSRLARPLSSYRSSSQSIEEHLKKGGVETPAPSDVRDAVREIRSRIGMVAGMYKSAGSFFKNVIVSADEFARLHTLVEEKFAVYARQFTPWHWKLDTGEEKVSTAFLMECTPFNKTTFSKDVFNGTVSISPLHTLSIINVGDARADDVRAFADCIAKKIYDEFGVALESEVCFL